ncbi:NAD-binding protein [bacterium]|nr:NAD-binding protein [bacterium]
MNLEEFTEFVYGKVEKIWLETRGKEKDKKREGIGKGETLSSFEQAEEGGYIVIIGCNELTFELVRSLKNSVKVVVIDQEAEKLVQLEKLPDSTIRVVAGDASSALVLEAAGVSKANWLIILLRDDRTTQEITVLARDRFSVSNMIALVQSEVMDNELEAQGIATIYETGSLIQSIRKIMFPGKHFASGVGLEAGELMEVLVLPSSPIVGVPLSEIRPKNWILAAIYRDEDVLIPHGDTVVQAGDRVLIVGNPTALPRIAEFIHRGQPGFPLNFGSGILILDLPDACGDNNVVTEGCYLVSVTQSLGGKVISEKGVASECSYVQPEGCDKKIEWCDCERPLEEVLTDASVSGEYGLIVIPHRTKPGFINQGILGLSSWEDRIMRLAKCPVLISRGTQPYRKILVCLAPDSDPLWLGSSALELASLLDSKITAATATPPDLVIGKGEHASQVAILEHFIKIARVYGLHPETKPLIGNPVRELSRLAEQHDLVIIANTIQKKRRLLAPDISQLLMLSMPCSTLVFPDFYAHEPVPSMKPPSR